MKFILAIIAALVLASCTFDPNIYVIDKRDAMPNILIRDVKITVIVNPNCYLMLNGPYVTREWRQVSPEEYAKYEIGDIYPSYESIE